MASPLNLRGGLQLTQQNPATSAAMRWVWHSPSFIAEAGFDPPAGYPLHFHQEAPGLVVDTAYTRHVSLEYGEASLALTPTGSVVTFNATRMFLVFG